MKTHSKKQGGAKIPYVGPYFQSPSIKLWEGVNKNNYKMVEEAFKEGADVNYKNDNGQWFLFVAVEKGNVRMVNLLLEKGVDVNVTDDYNNTALLTAVKNGKQDVVKLLLEKGADINKANNGDETILMSAINYDEEEVIKILLAYDEGGVRVDLNARNNNGETALIRAVQTGNTDIVEVVMDAEADMNIRDNDGNTPLIWASMVGEEYILDLLLESGSDVNATNNAGETALIVASRLGWVLIVEWLLTLEEEEEEDGTYMNVYGTDINATNNAGETALIVAKQYGHEEIVDLLRDAGADDTIIPPPSSPLLPPPPQPDNMTRLLVRDKVSLEKSVNNPFTELELTRYDPILMESVQFCDYVEDDKDNLLFIFNKQVGFIEKSRIKDFISQNTLDKNKIIYQCKKTDQAFQPRDENIVGGPALNMDIIGLFGVMVPLSYLDEVVNGKHQIFVIESTNANKTMPIASLNTRLGGNVVSTNHCQTEVAIQVSKLSYVDNDVLIGMCKKGGKRKSKKRTKKSTKTKKSKRRTKKSTKRPKL